jgi:AraC-like DNA-binding protein
MKDFHIVQITFLLPMIAALRDSGAPVDRLLRRAGLDKFHLEDPKSVVPVSCANEFFEIVARQETGPEVPHEISSQYTISNLRGWGEYILACPDLLTACQNVSQSEANIHSNERMGIRTEGSSSWLTDAYYTAPGLAKNWTEYLTVRLMIDGFRRAGGDKWIPLSLHVSGERQYGILNDMADCGVDVSIRRDEIAVEFPTQLLASVFGENTQSYNGDLPGVLNGTLAAERIEQVLDSSTEEYSPLLNEVARSARVSPRSLQRKLQVEGTSFSKVIDNWRFKRAMKLIDNHGISVSEMGQRLRYAESPHFVRAFRRWTGTTPQRFRESQIFYAQTNQD